jgi:streptomycin 6-kinase
MSRWDSQLPMPRNLQRAAEDEGRTAWLATLPQVIDALADDWSLSVGFPFEPGGQTAWVAPVQDASGAELVLKIGWPHAEMTHEADALRAWAGNGAVRLLASAEFDDTLAFLIERCVPGRPLSTVPEEDQDVVVAGLLRRLWGAPVAGFGFRPLQVMCDQWADEFEHKITTRPTRLDPGLTRDGIALFRSLPATADRHVLLCTDLHAGNVLSAERERWLVIDPNPYVGDPAYDALQHMLNCDGRMRADPRALASRMADLLDLDRDRVLLWLFARCVQESPDWPGLVDVARQIAPS